MIKKQLSLKTIIIVLGAGAVLAGILSFSLAYFKNPVVTFSDGETVLFSVEVKKGEAVARISDPEKDEYDFIGWLLGNEPYDFNKPVTDDINLTADFRQWQYVSFMVYEQLWQKTRIINGKVEMPENPVKEGFAFVQWVKDGQVFDGSMELSESCTVTAQFKQYVKLTSLSFVKDSYTVEAGRHFTAEIIGKPENWVENITYSSSDESIVRIDKNGKVTGIKPGKAKITAVSESGKKAVATVNVIIYPTDISLEETIGMDNGTERKLEVVFSPENTTETALTYHSSDEKIVSVDTKGNLKAVGFGKAVITVTTVNNISRTVNVYSNGYFITAAINNIKAGQDVIRLYNNVAGNPVYPISLLLHYYDMDMVSISSIDGNNAVMKGADSFLCYNPSDADFDGEPSICATEEAYGNKMAYSRNERIWFEYTDENGKTYSSDIFDILIEAEIKASCTTPDTAEIIDGTIYVKAKEDKLSNVFAIAINHECEIRTDSSVQLLNSRVVTGKKGSTYYYTFSFTRGANVVGIIVFKSKGGQALKFDVVSQSE